MSAQGLVNSLLANLSLASQPPNVIVAVDDGKKVEYSGERELVFDMGSLSKILSTTSIFLKLVESGDLQMDDPVSRYLPGSSFQGITLRNLLCHRAGLWEWRPFYIELAGNRDLISYIGEFPLRYEIDTERHYSDLGFIVLGEVIQRICQKSLDVVFREFVVDPLKLSSTTYRNPFHLDNCVASSYGDAAELKMVRDNSPYEVNANPNDFTHWRDYVLQGEVNDGNAFHVMNSVSGHAGVFSSVKDVMYFGREILNSLAGNGWFKESVVRDFLTYEKDQDQALGFQRYRIENHSNTFTAFGHTGFPGVALAVIPEVDQVVGLFSNRLLVSGEPFQTRTKLIELLTLQLFSKES